MMVSVPCLGTMTFGWEPHDWGSDETESLAVLNKALEMGVNFLDTADIYGRGSSESILGKGLKGKRDKLVVASKCHFRMDDDDPNAYGNSRRNIIQACEASLSRLQTDWIDLYQIHRPQAAIPIDETLRALDDLIRAGKVRYVGCSTFAAWQVAEAHYVARALGASAFVTEQPPYNLLDRRIERELLPFCRTYELGVLPWSPLAGGQLTGKYLEGRPQGARYSSSDPSGRVNKQSVEATRRIKRIADQSGLSLLELSLGWVASQPGVTTPIVGARSVDQLERTIQACQTKISPKVMERIDRVLPPGGMVSDYYWLESGPSKRPFV